jgi:hypothetical protein
MKDILKGGVVFAPASNLHVLRIRIRESGTEFLVLDFITPAYSYGMLVMTESDSNKFWDKQLLL